MKKPEVKQFGAWNEDGYYNLFSSLEDAVTENPGELIYEASFKPLGLFEVKVTKKLRKKKVQK